MVGSPWCVCVCVVGERGDFIGAFWFVWREAPQKGVQQIASRRGSGDDGEKKGGERKKSSPRTHRSRMSDPRTPRPRSSCPSRAPPARPRRPGTCRGAQQMSERERERRGTQQACSRQRKEQRMAACYAAAGCKAGASYTDPASFSRDSGALSEGPDSCRCLRAHLSEGTVR